MARHTANQTGRNLTLKMPMKILWYRGKLSHFLKLLLRWNIKNRITAYENFSILAKQTGTSSNKIFTLIYDLAFAGDFAASR